MNNVSYCYAKRQRLTKADEFSSVFSLRRTVHSRFFQAFIRLNHLHSGRLGITVTKRVERRAVRRNYIKRVIREHFRQHAKEVDGLDVVVRVKHSFYRQEGPMARAALHELWRKINRCPV